MFPQYNMHSVLYVVVCLLDYIVLPVSNMRFTDWFWVDVTFHTDRITRYKSTLQHKRQQQNTYGRDQKSVKYKIYTTQLILKKD